MLAYSVVIAIVLITPKQQQRSQKCLTHLERDLKALTTSRFEGNRDFAEKVFQILTAARTAHRDYLAQKLTIEDLSNKRSELEAKLQGVLGTPPNRGWPADARAFASATAKVLVRLVHLLKSSRS